MSSTRQSHLQPHEESLSFSLFPSFYYDPDIAVDPRQDGQRKGRGSGTKNLSEKIVIEVPRTSCGECDFIECSNIAGMDA